MMETETGNGNVEGQGTISESESTGNRAVALSVRLGNPLRQSWNAERLGSQTGGTILVHASNRFTRSL